MTRRLRDPDHGPGHWRNASPPAVDEFQERPALGWLFWLALLALAAMMAFSEA